MKRFSVYLAVLLIAGALFATVFDPGASRSQSKGAGQPGLGAAKRNALLSTSLIWIFGSKQQQGWYLYTPLIKRLIDTKQEIARVQFARAVARWQAKAE